MSPNHWVDIEPVLEQKITALRMHESQVGAFPVKDFITRMARAQAQGSPYSFAESFRRLELE